MILIFFLLREKAHDNKEYSRENSKPVKSVKSNPEILLW